MTCTSRREALVQTNFKNVSRAENSDAPDHHFAEALIFVARNSLQLAGDPLSDQGLVPSTGKGEPSFTSKVTKNFQNDVSRRAPPSESTPTTRSKMQ